MMGLVFAAGFCWVLGFLQPFAGWIQKRNAIDGWGLGHKFSLTPLLSTSPPHWRNIFSPSHLFLLFSLSAPHASISVCSDHHKICSSCWNFMPAGKSAPLDLSVTQEHGGESGKTTFSSCLFSMEKPTPLNDHFFGDIPFKKAAA